MIYPQDNLTFVILVPRGKDGITSITNVNWSIRFPSLRSSLFLNLTHCSGSSHLLLHTLVCCGTDWISHFPRGSQPDNQWRRESAFSSCYISSPCPFSSHLGTHVSKAWKVETSGKETWLGRLLNKGIEEKANSFV